MCNGYIHAPTGVMMNVIASKRVNNNSEIIWFMLQKRLQPNLLPRCCYTITVGVVPLATGDGVNVSKRKRSLPAILLTFGSGVDGSCAVALPWISTLAVVSSRASTKASLLQRCCVRSRKWRLASASGARKPKDNLELHPSPQIQTRARTRTLTRTLTLGLAARRAVLLHRSLITSRRSPQMMVSLALCDPVAVVLICSTHSLKIPHQPLHSPATRSAEWLRTTRTMGSTMVSTMGILPNSARTKFHSCRLQLQPHPTLRPQTLMLNL
mmetsp:Transcript_15379/g.39231  ORF Transcript_15379/g.39231 Transcript_15379/m.39231 type:complete len:268 (-) Transcript_15379:18-821(-)